MNSKTTLRGGLGTFIGLSYLLEWIHIVLIMNYHSVRCQNGPPVPFYENTVVIAVSDVLTNILLFASIMAFYNASSMFKKSYPLTVLFLLLSSAPIVSLACYIRMAASEAVNLEIIVPGITTQGLKSVATLVAVVSAFAD